MKQLTQACLPFRDKIIIWSHPDLTIFRFSKYTKNIPIESIILCVHVAQPVNQLEITGTSPRK